MRRLSLVLVLVACGGDEGEPIGGDIALTIGDQTILPTTGAAIRDQAATDLLIVIGTRDISCETTLASPLRKGTYVTMLIDRTAQVPGLQMPMTSMLRVDSNGTLINGDVGDVTIDGLADRVTGSVMFDTVDVSGGVSTPLGAAGTFDVINCAP